MYAAAKKEGILEAYRPADSDAIKTFTSITVPLVLPAVDLRVADVGLQLGDPLLQREAVATLRDELIPRARVITPNIPEAEILLGRRLPRQEELLDAARELSQGGRVSVFLKAGHLDDEELVDIFYDAESDRIVPLRSKRVATVNTHGTGCTLSSAIAAFLARGYALDDAAAAAKEYIAGAIAAGAHYRIGHGHGPVHHFYRFWE